MLSLIISLQLGQRKVRGLAITIFSWVRDSGTWRVLYRELLGRITGFSGFTNESCSSCKSCYPVRELTLVQFRSSSLKYLVPLPVSSSAMPLSVNWYIQTPGETE